MNYARRLRMMLLALAALTFAMLAFNFIVNPSTMTVLDTVQGFRQDIHTYAMGLCGQ